jgi:LmbE family N-acetylglucosaminyl deacetylase
MRSIAIAFGLILLTRTPGQGQETALRILVIGAHPDDCDSCAGGTAIQWAELGHRVKFLSLTNGDAGHQSQGGGALAKRRRAESEEAGRRFGISEYEVLDNHDGELQPTLSVRGQVIRAIRRWSADLVILPRPNDYHPDHRNTGLVVQDAAYMVIVPNVAPDTPPLARNPVFLYCRDAFQRPNPFRPDVAVDITSVYEKKIRALDAHVSQFYEWLPWTEGRLAEVPPGAEERKKWLAATRVRPITPEIRAALERGYGAERAQKAVQAEAFEICEYGTRPDDEALRRFFPMIRR